jgi:hypothetical protein
MLDPFLRIRWIQQNSKSPSSYSHVCKQRGYQTYSSRYNELVQSIALYLKALSSKHWSYFLNSPCLLGYCYVLCFGIRLNIPFITEMACQSIENSCVKERSEAASGMNLLTIYWYHCYGPEYKLFNTSPPAGCRYTLRVWWTKRHCVYLGPIIQTRTYATDKSELRTLHLGLYDWIPRFAYDRGCLAPSTISDGALVMGGR